MTDAAEVSTEVPTFPLHLCEVLEQELDALLPPTGAGKEDCWDFSPSQIRGKVAAGIFARLRDSSTGVDRLLARRLSPAFRDQLSRQGGAQATLTLSLVDELNRLLREEREVERRGEPADEAPSFLDELILACRQDGTCLSADLTRLVDGVPKERRRLLRLLLEEVFPSEIEPIYEVRMAALRRRAHESQPGLSAICLSGGGIRSAVFSLGVVQELGRRKLLGGFDYLSTVSGGGYLGGMLSAWIHRHPNGVAGVEDELGGRRPEIRTFQSEPPPLEYLRSYGNYLTPKLGILSGDSWTLAAIFLRNLTLFWLVAIPLLLAVLALPRLYVALCSMGHSGSGPAGFVGAAFSLVFPDGLLFLGALSMVAGLTYIVWNRPSAGNRGSPRGFFLFCLLPLVLAAILLTVYWAVSWTPGRANLDWGLVVRTSIAINALSWLAHTLPAWLKGRRQRGKLRELAIMLITGACGGFAALLAIRIFGDPSAIQSGAILGDPADFSSPRANGWSAFTAPWYGVFAVPIVLLATFLGETVFAGTTTRWTDDEDREWWSRIAAWLILVACAWMAVSAVVLFGPVLLAYWGAIVAPLGGLSGLATALLSSRSRTSESRAGKGSGDQLATVWGVVLALAAPTFVVILGASLSLGMSHLIGSFLGVLAPSRAGLPFAAWHLHLVSETPALAVLLFLGGALGFGFLMAYLIDINKFSLHAMYRNRLIRAFLGASREGRNPHPFTGFDSDDNLALSRLLDPPFLRLGNLRKLGAKFCEVLAEGRRPGAEEIVEHHLRDETKAQLFDFAALGTAPSLSSKEPPVALLGALVEDLNALLRKRFGSSLVQALRLTEEELEELRAARSDDALWALQRKLLVGAFPEIGKAPPPKPLHLINVALNLVGGKKLAWQQRKAEPFTFSALHSGSARVGYRSSCQYARGGTTARPITLGTAMAISGAAASPNMGYHSSPAITFLMTFFNARLGWWLGNPGTAGVRTYREAQPKWAVTPLLYEALGLTDDASPYVYLSDGGHFENLGLYEMVLRRCRRILVVDAGQDEGCRFEDLGNALRKIRIDLGVQIRLDEVPIWSEVPPEKKGRYCAIGKILYSQTDGGDVDGWLLYVKPAVYDDGEPKDVVNYQKLNRTFPHESTADQWFSESQFESYRALGQYAIHAICEAQVADEVTKGKEIADIPELFRVAQELYLEARQAAQDAPTILGGGVAAFPLEREVGNPVTGLGPAERVDPSLERAERPPEAA